MKILMVGPIGSPIVQRLASQLRRSGSEVWVASYEIQGAENYINLGPLKRFSCFLKFWKINNIVKEINPDLVHAHVVNHYGLMSIFQKKPLVVALWGSEVMLDPNEGSYCKKLIFRFINWLVFKRADRCHTSSTNIAEEAESQCRGVTKKTDVFYWGFPLEEPTKEDAEITELSLKNEFGIAEGGLIIFPRGLSSVYNPRAVAKIVNKLTAELSCTKRIVVLKAFASAAEECAFKSMVKIDKITYISRVLSSNELWVLYRKAYIHVSVPLSDSLGSGVIEPALLGSFPVLSNLKPYVEYVRDNQGLILKSYDDHEIDELCRRIKYGFIDIPALHIPSRYSQVSVLSEMYSLYKKTLGDL